MELADKYNIAGTVITNTTTQSTLTVLNSDPSDTDQYLCVSGNAAGNDSVAISVIVYGM